ncbi:hypothetical protein N665_0080s0005 [Sinapis alba]|nr:hypothetical protein N665_0080s0005 [Sinapis alba]
MDPVCQACGFQGESINHILFSCSIARQVWALSNVPFPENGFDLVSHYSNIHYLTLMIKNPMISTTVKEAIPWIAWYLWKNRNAILFEGISFLPTEIISKIMVEAELWSMAQQHEKEKDRDHKEASKLQVQRWSPPNRGWLKCNIGMDWDRDRNRGGGAWVVRNDRGHVLMHSRRAFSNINDLHEAKYQALLWTLDSMIAHRLNHIIIALDDNTLTGMIIRPREWPNFKCYYVEVMKRLAHIEWWRIMKEDKLTTREAFLIAQSVTKGEYLQSYVASGAPFWLQELFENEERLPSVLLYSLLGFPVCVGVVLAVNCVFGIRL